MHDRRPALLVLLLALAALALPASASAQAYRIPQDNPFVGTPGVAPEIYSYGLRNPFRFSFDGSNIAIGDVGQSTKEEVDFTSLANARGGNFEWPCREGTIDPGIRSCGPLSQPIGPLLDYPNPNGSAAPSSAVTGGYVSHDPALPDFAGRLIYADFYDGKVFTVNPANASSNSYSGLTVTNPSAFGKDGGEGLYVVSLTQNKVMKLAQSGSSLTTVDVATGLSSPMYVTAPRGDPRLFIVERAGRVLVRQPSGAISTFLDLTGQTTTDGERGMSTIAFPPDYAASGRFYVYLSDLAGDIRVDELRVSSDPNRADPATRRNVLTIGHPVESNHYGGQLQFGPDGALYISTGDGGGGNDIHDNAQNLGTLLGKLLRIDPREVVASSTPARDTIPPRLLTRTTRIQRVLHNGAVIGYGRCSGEACKVAMAGRLQIGRRFYSLVRTEKIATVKRVKLRLRLTRRARLALAYALRHHRRAKVLVAYRARDTSGNRSPLKHATVRVRR